MKLTTAQLREWMDAEARGEISFGKLVENINEFFNDHVDANETKDIEGEILDYILDME